MNSSSPVASEHPESITGISNEFPKRILEPLVGSDFSFRAAKYAINLAMFTRGEIICLHAIVDLPYTESMGPHIVTVTSYIDEAKNMQRTGFPK